MRRRASVTWNGDAPEETARMATTMAKLLGLDIGTSGCKALLIDETGRVLKSASAEYPLDIPKPLWAEQNPEDWWVGVLSCIEQIGERRPDAIGLSGQMHGAVFLDGADHVIRPAILWNDQRTAEECRQIDETVGADKVRAITCNPPLTGFQAPKLLWLRNHESENYAKLRSLLLPKDYIRLQMSAEKFTEVSDASGTGLLDVPNRRWATEMIGLLGLDASVFPECRESDEATTVTKGCPGLVDGIPIVGGGGDQAAGAVGTGAVAPGIISVSLGTSGVVFTSLESPGFDPGGAAHTFCHANRAWHAMGVMLSCGGALRWYRDVLHSGSYDSIAQEAVQAPIGCDGLTFLPYLTGERCPHNDPFARAAFAGLTLGHSRAHLSRAVFEGLSFGLLGAMNLLIGLGARSEEIRVTGGGAKSAFWVQMLADMFGKRCVTLVADEGPAFGAAILAGVGIDVWPDVAVACAALVRVKAQYEPSGADFDAAYRKYRALYQSVRDWNRS